VRFGTRRVAVVLRLPKAGRRDRMRDTEAQISIDFLIGILVFAGILFFALQFIGSTAAPFISSQTTDEKVTKVHNVGDRLYYDKLANDASREGELDLEYFGNTTGTGVKNETALSENLGLGQRYNMSLRVTDIDGDPVELNSEPIEVGESSPGIGGAGAKATRVGHTATNGTVVIDLEVW